LDGRHHGLEGKSPLRKGILHPYRCFRVDGTAYYPGLLQFLEAFREEAITKGGDVLLEIAKTARADH